MNHALKHWEAQTHVSYAAPTRCDHVTRAEDGVIAGDCPPSPADAPNRLLFIDEIAAEAPPVASGRLALTASGQVRYMLKTPYRDGTTHIVLEPLDLMARLAALVPAPRMHLNRYHRVFAPHSQYRSAVTPAQRGRGAARPPVPSADPTSQR